MKPHNRRLNWFYSHRQRYCIVLSCETKCFGSCVAGVVCHIILLCLKQRKNPFDVAIQSFEEKDELLDRTVDPTQTQTEGESLYDVMT